MAFSVSRPKKKLREAIKKRHPNAKENEIKQFIHVWNNVFEQSGSEARAFASAWGVLNKNKKLESSHEKTDPTQTKKDVKKWDKKHGVKKPKKKKKKTKKSKLLSYLVKLANELDEQGMVEEAELVDSIMSNLTLDL
jgi:hypothetical protein